MCEASESSFVLVSGIMKILLTSFLLWTVLEYVSATPLQRNTESNTLDVPPARFDERRRSDFLERRNTVCEPAEDKTVTVTQWKTKHFSGNKQPSVTRITETSWVATTMYPSIRTSSSKETAEGTKSDDSFPPMTKSPNPPHDTKETYTSVAVPLAQETQSRPRQHVHHDSKNQPSSSISRTSVKSSTIVTTSHVASKKDTPKRESTPVHSHRLSTGPRPACSAEYHDEHRENATTSGPSQANKHSKTKNTGPTPTTVIKTKISGTDLTITATSIAGGKLDCGKYNIFGIEVCINGSGNGNHIKF